MSSLRTVSTIALCAGLAGLMAACSKPAAGGGAGGTAPGASAAAGGDVVINEADLPHPRAGSWEMVSNNPQRPERTTFCVTDRPFSVGKIRAYCQKFVFHRTFGGGLSIDSECGHGGVTSKMHMTASGDFKSAYSTDMQIAITMHPGEQPHLVNTHMDYRYVGACSPAEQAAAQEADKGSQGE
jgi:hypothetical protein